MKRHWLRFAMLALLLAGYGLHAPIAQANTTCSATAPTLNFGTVAVTGVVTDATGTFSITCTTGAVALLARARVRMCLSIGDGVSGGGNFNPRRMLNSFNDPLQFYIYQDAGRSLIWGARGNPTVPNPLMVDFDYAVPLLGGSQTINFTMYGRVPVQTLTAGTYSNPFTGIHTAIEFRFAEQLLGTPPFPASCTSGGNAGVGSTFPFTASATVPVNCRAYATTELNFGSISGLITANNDQTSTIGMTCTGRTAWTVGLNNGLNPSGIVRRMRLGATTSYVNYELFRETGRTNRWGNTIGTNTVPGTGTGIAQSLTVFGRVPAPQAAAAGSYSDTITVTITY